MRPLKGIGCLVEARHIKDGKCLSFEGAYLFLPDASDRRMRRLPIRPQLIFWEDDSLILFSDASALANLIERKQVDLAEDGYWQLSPMQSEVLASLPDEVKEWGEEDRQVPLDEFLAAVAAQADLPAMTRWKCWKKPIRRTSPGNPR